MHSQKPTVLIFIFLLSLASAFFTPTTACESVKPELHSLLAGWGIYSRGETAQCQLGFRFLPEFTLDIQLGSQKLLRSLRYTTSSAAININNQTNSPAIGSSFHRPEPPSLSETDHGHLTAEVSLNLWGTLTIQTSQENQFGGKIKPYRLSMKYATSRFEARLGLQKISFGSATLIRPLMWFDRVDPRDPIQLTDGVYGLLVRTYISTRTILWSWVLYGNKNPKGWEILSTQNSRPEFGARAQVPAGRGELAFTFHQRRCHFEGSSPTASMVPVSPGSPSSFNFPETRMAADGKWDLGIGLWFEATLTKQQSPYLTFPWQRALTIGLDYTFVLGNGLHLLGEYFQSDVSKEALANDTFPPLRARFLAASASYPFTPLDYFSAIVFFDASSHDLYSFVRWQRSYDRWSLNLMAFWNPTEYRIFAAPPTGQVNLFAGRGLQLMLLYNF